MQELISMTLEKLMSEMKEWSQDVDISFLPSRLRQGYVQITLKASTRNYMKESKIMKLLEIYQMLQAIRTLCTVKTQGMPCDPMNEYKICAYHLIQKGHSTNECRMLKAKIYDLINSGKITHLYGPHTMLECDRVEPEVPITNNLTVHHLYFMTFKDSYDDIYFKLVQAKILHPIKRKERKGFTK